MFAWGLGLFVASEGFLTFFRHLSLPRFAASDICHSDVCHLTFVGVSSLTNRFFFNPHKCFENKTLKLKDFKMVSG